MYSRYALAVAAVLCCVVGMASAVDLEGSLESDWNDFLHYAAIGHLELAEGYAQRIIESDPDPLRLLEISEANPKGFQLVLKMRTDSPQLAQVADALLDIIEEGRFLRRTDPKIILAEIARLSTNERGRIAARQRLKNSGEYAIPFLVDVLHDPDRKSEYVYITEAMIQIGRLAIRPLTAALQTDNVGVRMQIVRVLGEIGYPQSLAYLQDAVETDASSEVVATAQVAIEKIDTGAMKVPAAEHFFQLGVRYYDHDPSLAPMVGYDYANVWFWDEQSSRLVREEVDPGHFHELMAMRCSELALQADENIGKAIGLWIASFFKAEGQVDAQPEYFGAGHADAMTYATTAGPEYLHQALERALRESNAYVSLEVVEALAANAGEKSLLYQIGTEQPLVKALSFDDRAVRYSAAIAIGGALPNSEFVGSKLIAQHLAEAIGPAGLEKFGQDLTDEYALRSLNVMFSLAMTDNPVVNLAEVQDSIIAGTEDSREFVQILSGQVLAWMESPDCQRAIGRMALDEGNSMNVRLAAFASLAVSAKQNASLLTEEQIDAIYAIVSSKTADVDLRSGAASAYGALNLPSHQVKDLILSQASR